MIKKVILLLIFICFLGYFVAAKVFQKDTDNLISKKNGELVTIKTGFSFTEGPAVDKHGNVFFTDQPNDIIYKWDAKTNQVAPFLKKKGRSNGMAFDKEGYLIDCADMYGEF